MKITFSIDGKLLKERVLDGMKKVLFLSMLKMNELAVIYVPVDKGLLKSRINLLPAVPGYIHYDLTAGTIYSAAVEFGTSPRVIKAVQVMHPGTEAQPFFRPALDQVKGVWVGRYWNQVFK